MGKKATVNGFTEGLSMDLNALTDTKETLIDALNATLVTGNGNEMILQNDDGNVKIAYKDKDNNIQYVSLKNGYIPIGIKEFGGIIYIASIHGTDCELGSFPSPNYIDINKDKEGKLEYIYRPLNNFNKGEFNTPFLKFDIHHPVTIDVQKSYDGSVNLILNDGYNIPRLINTGFAVISKNKYKIPTRINYSTNQYVNNDQTIFDIETSLTKRYNKIPKIAFNGVLNNGSMKVGNYVFYFRYADADGNETDIVAESGIVSCFQGNNADPFSINGGFRDNNSNKSVSFTLSNLDTGFDYIKVSYSRNTSDLDQNRVTSVVNIEYKFKIVNNKCNIVISGNEKTSSSTIDELNQQYTILNSVKSETQSNNILFSANVSISDPKYSELTDLSQKILPYVYSIDSKDKIGEISDETYKDISNTKENDITHIYTHEYYNVKNIYYNVGYWPEEFYRFGIVYIFEDGTLSPVYNVRGCDTLPYYTTKDGNKVIENYYNISEYTKIQNNIYYNKNSKISDTLQNNKGVVRIKKRPADIRQLYGIGFYTNFDVLTEFKKLNIKGAFYVRQKRLPTILCQAYLMPNDINSNLPYIYRQRYTQFNTDESLTSPLYVQKNSNPFNIKKYRNGLVGESFLWHGGYKPDEEFIYKSDGPNFYIKIPEGKQRYGYYSSESYIRKGDSYTYSNGIQIVSGTFEDVDTEVDNSGNITKVIFTLKVEVKDYTLWPTNIEIYGYSFTKEDVEHADDTIKYYCTNEEFLTKSARNIVGIFYGQKELNPKMYDQYLDYEGRLFYFPLYNINSEYPKGKLSYTQKFPYEKFINRQYRWSAYSPDFMIKQSYYNQLFTGGKFISRVADISTPNYESSNQTYFDENNKNTYPGYPLNSNVVIDQIYNSHKYLLQEGNHKNGKFRQYHIGNENLKQTDKDKTPYEEIYCVSLTDSATVASTNDNKQSIFRAVAGNAQEAHRCRYYYNNLNDNDLGKGNIKNQPYSGNDSILKNINITINNTSINLGLTDTDTYNTSPVVRGIYSPYIGITKDTPTILKEDDGDSGEYRDIQHVGVGEIINIYIPGFKPEINTYNINDIEEITSSVIYQYLSIRMHDTSPYYAISDRFDINSLQTSFDNLENICYRGDCYFSTYTQRINRNFQDPSAPTNNIVVDNETWWKYGLGGTSIEDNQDHSKLNSGDVNAAPLGSWITFKCCTNYNLSIRSIDNSNTSEKALTGQSRSFCPLNSPDMSASSKIPESESMNDGFNTTVGDKHYFTIEDSQYINNKFQNRIYYSDVSQEESFRNGYRVVKSVNFRDYNPEYGSITKILPYNDYLLVVFEHAIGICQIYEKNLITQNTGSQVYINSNNILPLKLTILSDCIGSQWGESVIKTPYFIYGIDTNTKKIWRVNNSQVEIISDFKVESFLNKNIDITSKDTQPYLGVRNVKTHYNASKSEVMFTYYNNSDLFNNNIINDNYIQWNLAYNEINKCFTTFFSWLPAYSENIDNVYYSFDNYQLIYNIINKQSPKCFLYRHGVVSNDKLQEMPKPCYWYDTQEPFEFEFTVRDDPSVQKIWNNLQIISNKAEPQSFHFQVVGESYEFKKDKPNIYYRQEATKELWHNLGSSIHYDTDYIKHATPDYTYTIQNRFSTESPYTTIKGISKSTYFPLYYKRQKKGLDIEYQVSDSVRRKIFDWKYLSGSELIYDEKTNSFNIATHIKCVPRSKYGTLRGNSEYVEDKWEVQIPLINMVQKNEQQWKIPPIIIDYVPTDIKETTITADKLPTQYINIQDIQDQINNQDKYWPNNLDLNKWTSTKQMPIRDKYIKIRIRYDGTEKAIISAIKTIYTESFA